MFDIKLAEIASAKKSEIIVTEEQVKAMFGKFKDFVLKRNIPEYKKFIHDFVDEVLVYKDHIEEYVLSELKN